MSNLIGHSLGRYQILEPLGEGGMAIVYKAYDTRLESEVAVKVIRIERLAPEILQRAMKRFEREAKSLAQLTHPNLVKVLDYGEYEGQPYLVMPYLMGGTLKQKMNGQPMPWQEAARLLIPIARALDYAHKRNLIHRDIKPSNILITESGEPMLTDFGVAKIIDEEATLDLTGTSAAVGTPEYMAPEQATSKNIDHRADIYALGIVFYEMVTGRRPFQADTPLAVLFKQASEPLPRPKSVLSQVCRMRWRKYCSRHWRRGQMIGIRGWGKWFTRWSPCSVELRQQKSNNQRHPNHKLRARVRERWIPRQPLTKMRNQPSRIAPRRARAPRRRSRHPLPPACCVTGRWR